MKIEVIEKEKHGKKLFDIQINDETATVADYLDVMNSFIENVPLERTRHLNEAEHSTCYACNNCCQERIPLTWVDVLTLSKRINLKELFENNIYIYVSGRVVDITMKLNNENTCKLNASDTGLCGYYLDRPLVCQTYICCKFSVGANQLREVIVNTGEDQLVREWLRLVNEGVIDFKVDEAEDMEIDEGDWGPTSFEGIKNYADIKIKDLCSTTLWNKLKGFG